MIFFTEPQKQCKKLYGKNKRTCIVKSISSTKKNTKFTSFCTAIVTHTEFNWAQNRHRYQRNLMEDEEIKSTHIIIKSIYQKKSHLTLC